MQITIEPELRRLVEKRAKRRGVSFAEVVRQALRNEVGQARPSADVEQIFDLGKSDAKTHIARDKKQMIAESIAWKSRK